MIELWDLFALLAIVVGLIVLQVILGRRNSRRVRILLAAGSLLVGLVAGELWAFAFAIQSQGVDLSLASQRWMRLYWRPINSAGIRDEEWSDDRFNGKRIVALVGDSFVAGSGIQDVADRLPEETERLMGSEWEVVPIADRGWGPKRQIVSLRRFSYPIDVTVLAFFYNDIEEVLMSCGRVAEPPPLPQPSFGRWYVERSYLLNRLYWRWFQSSFSDRARTDFSGNQDLAAAYSDDRCWRLISSRLTELARYSQSRSRQVFAILFPDLTTPSLTSEALTRVRQHYAGLGVSSIDVTAVADGLALSERTVNALDPHPSASLLRLVADLVQQRILEGR